VLRHLPSFLLITRFPPHADFRTAMCCSHRKRRKAQAVADNERARDA
jgi:hypothetical protein